MTFPPSTYAGHAPLFLDSTIKADFAHGAHTPGLVDRMSNRSADVRFPIPFVPAPENLYANPPTTGKNLYPSDAKKTHLLQKDGT
jgi:hypothetical protein